MISATRSTPYCEVDFHTAKQMYTASKGGGWDTDQPTRDVLSIQTHKDLGTPVGTWQMELTAARGSDGMTWYDRLDSNQLVCIKMGRPPEKTATVMVGLIDEVRRTKTMGMDGSPQQRVLVRGSDLAKVLVKPLLKFYPALSGDPNTSGVFSAGGWMAMLNFLTQANLLTGTPAGLIKQSMVYILFRIMNLSFKYYDPDAANNGHRDIRLINLLRFRLAQTNWVIPFQLTMLDYEGAFWNFIERSSMKPFNELFVDTRGEYADLTEPEYMSSMVPNPETDSYFADGDPLTMYIKNNGIDTNPNYSASFGEDNAKVILFLRNTPFDYDSWNKLYTHEVNYDEIISEDIGRSDTENYNTFMAYNSLSVPNSVNLKLLVPPKIEADNVTTYGMSPLEVQIEGISIDADKQSNGIIAANQLSQTLYNWYHLNKFYKCGTIAVKGNGGYKVGQRLIIRNCEYDGDTGKWDDLIFYIEAVQQSFSVMDTWSSTLTLTRGQRLDTLKQTN